MAGLLDSSFVVLRSSLVCSSRQEALGALPQDTSHLLVVKLAAGAQLVEEELPIRLLGLLVLLVLIAEGFGFGVKWSWASLSRLLLIFAS